MNPFKRKIADPGYRPFVLPEPPPAPKLTVRDTTVVESRMLPRDTRMTADQVWTLPKPFPGVKPAAASGYPVSQRLAMDDMPNIGQVYAFAQASFFREGLGFMGYPYLAELTQRAEYRRVSEIIAKEMTRKGIKLTTTGGKRSADKLKKLDDAMKRYSVMKVLQKVAEHDGWFGVSHLFPDLGYDTNDRTELDAVLLLTPAKISKGSLKGFKVVEPWWTYPSMFNATDPLAADFYKMKHWYVMGKRVHASRLMTFIGREVPDMLKPMYCFGGISLSQIAKPYIDNWLETRQGVNDIVQAFTTWVLKTNMSGILEGGGLGDAQSLTARLDIFNNYRSNRGIMAVDNDSEDFLNVSAPIAGLHELQAQSQEHICSVTGIPLVVYTGITPSGLNASSEGEIQVFNNWIKSNQEHLFRPNLTRIIQMIQLSEFGAIDAEIDFAFEPLGEEKKLDKLAGEKQKADIAAVYVMNGVVSPEEERQRLQNDEDSIYNGVDLSGAAPEPPEDPNAPPDDEDDPDKDDDPGPKGQDGSFKEADHPRDKNGEFATVAASSGVEAAHSQFAQAKKPIPAQHFNAASYAREHDQADVTPQSVLSKFDPDTAARLAATTQKVQARGQTIDRYRTVDDGNVLPSYTTERLAVQHKVLYEPFTDADGETHPPILSPEKIAAAKPAPGERPVFMMLGGRGGSGKSKLAGAVYDPDKFLVLDSDKIKERLPEYEGWNANEVHEESSDILERAIAFARLHGLNVVLDATMKNAESAMRRLEPFISDGYVTEAHYMHLPRQEAAGRAIERFNGPTGRYVLPEVVLGNTTNEESFERVRQLVDRWSFRDNNVARGEEPIVISEGSKKPPASTRRRRGS